MGRPLLDFLAGRSVLALWGIHRHRGQRDYGRGYAAWRL